jgi:hypothetical protein
MAFGQQREYIDGLHFRMTRVICVFQFLTCEEGYIFRKYKREISYLKLFLLGIQAGPWELQRLGISSD